MTTIPLASILGMFCTFVFFMLLTLGMALCALGFCARRQVGQALDLASLLRMAVGVQNRCGLSSS